MRLLYGLQWPDDSDPVQIDLQFIRGGGFLTLQGKQYGEGLFAHYRSAQSLLWPEDDHHRWSDLILKEYLANRITVIMGSRDSSKTRSISKAVLLDYYAFAEETLILMTSTNIRGLELRVWGDIKSLHERAKERCPWLPGNVADSKHGIFTDSISEGDEVRDMRRGLICVPTIGSQGEYMGQTLKDFCFAEGTWVDTPIGPRRIENLLEGDYVYSAVGESRIMGTSRRSVQKLVRLHLNNGEHIDCTPGHRLLTDRGWRSAIDILPEDRLISTHEAMRILQDGLQSKSQQGAFLFKTLRDEVEVGTTRFEEEMAIVVACHRYGEWQEDKRGYTCQCGRPSTPPRKNEEVGSHAEEAKVGTWEERSLFGSWSESFTHSLRKDALGNVSRILSRLLHPNREKFKAGSFPDVLAGRGIPRPETRCGDGWVLPRIRSATEKGYMPGLMATATRVDRIEVLRPAGFKSHRNCSGVHNVYNLHIKGHPSFSVCGILVHNCGIKQKRRRLIGDELQFVPRDYLKVLDSLDKGDFRAGFLGNPIADNGMALDKVSEPENGWDSLGEVSKTSTWKNKYNGVTINLVGIDSPNFDEATRNRYDYLVDQGDVDRVSKRPGGRDSIEWWSQIMGVRKVGVVSNRVLTVPEIERYDGFKQAVWSGVGTMTRVYSIDAGFGGDDCVRTWLEFGEAVDGRNIISFGDQKVIPIMLSSGMSAEKQIAQYAKGDCETLGIPPSHLFFDAGMYATLAVELARAMSPEVNAVNFGGSATERPVSADMYVYDQQTQMRRLKTWYEHVSKFVTELWFVVRLLTQCRQARNFPRAAAEEFGRRQWKYVYNDRYELESKDDYKLRNQGESPNHADSLVIGVEGARRLGFTIEALPEGQQQNQNDQDYLQIELTKYNRERKKRQLRYSLHE